MVTKADLLGQINTWEQVGSKRSKRRTRRTDRHWCQAHSISCAASSQQTSVWNAANVNRRMYWEHLVRTFLNPFQIVSVQHTPYWVSTPGARTNWNGFSNLRTKFHVTVTRSKRACERQSFAMKREMAGIQRDRHRRTGNDRQKSCNSWNHERANPHTRSICNTRWWAVVVENSTCWWTAVSELAESTTQRKQIGDCQDAIAG